MGTFDTVDDQDGLVSFDPPDVDLGSLLHMDEPRPFEAPAHFDPNEYNAEYGDDPGDYEDSE